MTDRDQEIAKRAYRIWEDAGRPDGEDMDHWSAAEAEIGPPETSQGDEAPAPGSVVPAAREKSVKAGKAKADQSAD